MSERINPSGEPLPNSPLEVLKSAAQRVSQLDTNAGRALYLERDVASYNDSMRKKAEIVVGLPVELDKLSERGIPVSDRVSDWSLGWASLARMSIETDNYFGMATLFTPKGSNAGEPSALEKLIDQLENPQTLK